MTIFLPLSFLTSYFAMNTSDIRGMGSTQPLFWVIAVPLTSVVPAVILGIAYNGDGLRSKLSSLMPISRAGDRAPDAAVMSIAVRERINKDISRTTEGGRSLRLTRLNLSLRLSLRSS